MGGGGRQQGGFDLEIGSEEFLYRTAYLIWKIPFHTKRNRALFFCFIRRNFKNNNVSYLSIDGTR